jgi:carotenoid cleavage dioxygenase-like enzyme
MRISDIENPTVSYFQGNFAPVQQQRSECIILDAARFENWPIARVMMPARVPFGFHSAWVDQQVWRNQL